MQGIPLEVERAVLRELTNWWRHIANGQFHGQMKPASIHLHDGVKHLGRWVAADRSISLSRTLVANASWVEVLEVLKHEMAHQYVTEVMGLGSVDPHGAAFRDVCAARGIEASARRTTSLPVAPATARALDKIRRLLALTASPNEHEARAAAAAAHRLLARHELEASELEEPGFVVRQLGEVRKRVPKHARLLGGTLLAQFQVHGIWIPAFDVDRGVSGTVFELSGRLEQVELAEWTHVTILRAGETAWKAHRAKSGLTGDKYRRGFLQGFVLGYGRRVREEAASAEAVGLVRVGDPRLAEWSARRYPRTRRGRRLDVRGDAAARAGMGAGREHVVRAPLSSSGTASRRAIEGPTKG